MRVYVVMEFCQNDESKREEGYLANVYSSRKAAERFIEERSTRLNCPSYIFLSGKS